MKIALENHGIGILVLELVLVAVLCRGIASVGAQPSPPEGLSQYPPYTTFTPSMAIIVVILVAALFFMVFFSIYIRRCSDNGSSGGRLSHALSFRSRRNGARRGLDPAVVETFPTFSYSEVKDHKIGKGALECAVCLNEFDDDETLRLLPKCDHVFHTECIDAWLEMHVTCPVCRANLVPLPAEAATHPPDSVENLDSESMHPRIDETAVQVDTDLPLPQPPPMNRNPSIGSPPAPGRSWSIRRPRVFGFGKFRSHSTGHSLVQPGDNLDRFTLRLPEEVRKEVMDRASLNRTRSCAAATLPREGSSRLGYRTGAGEGSSRNGRFYRRLDRPDGGTKSDQWGFLTRGFSVRSTKVVAESGGNEGSSRGPTKMPSFRCLEPKTVEEAGLVWEDPNRSPV